MPLTFKEIIDEVHRKIPERIMQEFFSHLIQQYNNSKLKLWGKERGRAFVKKCTYLGFYHDIKNERYTQMANITGSWVKIPGPTICNNWKEIRKALSQYVLDRMNHGSVNE